MDSDSSVFFSHRQLCTTDFPICRMGKKIPKSIVWSASSLGSINSESWVHQRFRVGVAIGNIEDDSDSSEENDDGDDDDDDFPLVAALDLSNVWSYSSLSFLRLNSRS